jgi:mono/diheme cytochrome c family protein
MRARKTPLLMSLIFVLGASLLFAAGGDGLWMTKVPERDRVRQNPFDSEADAVAAGAKLFRQNCSSCHGGEATGVKNRPNLHSDRIRVATPGELEWLLKNGSMKNGMPSWSKLPEQQRWQIVAFLKSLQ